MTARSSGITVGVCWVMRPFGYSRPIEGRLGRGHSDGFIGSDPHRAATRLLGAAAASYLPAWNGACVAVAVLEPLSAQEHRIAAPTCGNCSILVGDLVILGSSGGVNGTLNAIVRDSSGRYFVSSLETRDEIEVYNAAGSRLGTIGRAGSGPGELGAVYELAVTDTILHVFDANHLRWFRFTLDGRFLTSSAIPGTPYAVGMIDPDRAVINTSVRSAEQAGIPLFLVNSAGVQLRAFGENGTAYRYDHMFSGMREVAARNGRIWAALRTSYRLEVWDTVGVLRETILRDAAWFPTIEAWQMPEAGGPPPTALTAICSEPQGRLWVVSNVADPNLPQLGKCS